MRTEPTVVVWWAADSLDALKRSVGAEIHISSRAPTPAWIIDAKGMWQMGDCPEPPSWPAQRTCGALRAALVHPLPRARRPRVPVDGPSDCHPLRVITKKRPRLAGGWERNDERTKCDINLTW